MEELRSKSSMMSAQTADSHSDFSYSGGSSSGRKQYTKKWILHKFKTTWEYMVITLGCTFTIQSFFAFVVIDNNKNQPSIIHHIICFIIIGLPLNYMKLLIGQYSQLGAILFKHLCPIGHGVGYAMLLNSLVWCCYFGETMADFMMYLLASLDTQLDWMTCPNNTEDYCWDIYANCSENCITKDIQGSSFVYWRESYMDGIDLFPKKLRLGYPMLARFAPLSIIWAVTFIFVTMNMSKYIKIIRANLDFILVLLPMLMLVCFLADGASRGVKLMFRINLYSFFSIQAWSVAIHTTIQVLALSRACHMMYGTYLSSHMSADILTIFNVFMNFIAAFLGGVITHAAMGITMAAAGVESNNLTLVWYDNFAPCFTVLTSGMGFLSIPQLWSIIYLLLCILIIMNNLVTQIDAIEKTIADAHSSIRVYRNYMVAAICIICAIFSFIFSSKEGFTITEYFKKDILPRVDCFIVLVMCFLTFWVYRVQRLCDDIHFMQGYQPTKFWKVFWYIMPCLLTIPCVSYTFISEITNESYTVLFYTWYFGLISPIPLFMIYEIFMYLKIHNLVGIVQPEERWGPPDPIERYLRNLFNPRQETKSRKRDTSCYHNCLLNSKYLKKTVLLEKDERMLMNRNLSVENFSDPDDETMSTHRRSGSLDSDTTEINVN